MPFFCRLQAGHSCFFKENFVFLGRKKSTHDNIVSLYPILCSIIRHDQSPSCLSLPLFLVNKIMFFKKAWPWFGPSEGLNSTSPHGRYALKKCNRAKYRFLYIILE